jgi:hypothetical protein
MNRGNIRLDSPCVMETTRSGWTDLTSSADCIASTNISESSPSGISRTAPLGRSTAATLLPLLLLPWPPPLLLLVVLSVLSVLLLWLLGEGVAATPSPVWGGGAAAASLPLLLLLLLLLLLSSPSDAVTLNAKGDCSVATLRPDWEPAGLSLSNLDLTCLCSLHDSTTAAAATVQHKISSPNSLKQPWWSLGTEMRTTCACNCHSHDLYTVPSQCICCLHACY